MYSTLLLAVLVLVAIGSGLAWQERRIRRLRGEIAQLHTQQQALVRNLAARDTAAEIIRAAGAVEPRAVVKPLPGRRHLSLVRGEHGLIALVAVAGGWFVARQTRVAAGLAVLSAGTLVSSAIVIAPHQEPAQSRSTEAEPDAPIVSRTVEQPPPLIITSWLPSESIHVAITPAPTSTPSSTSSVEVASSTRETPAKQSSSEPSSAVPSQIEPDEAEPDQSEPGAPGQPENDPGEDVQPPVAEDPPPTPEPRRGLLSDLLHVVRVLLLV